MEILVKLTEGQTLRKIMCKLKMSKTTNKTDLPK